MIRTLRVRPEAEQEIVAAAEWYETRRGGLAAEFLRSIDAAVAAVERSPFNIRKSFQECGGRFFAGFLTASSFPSRIRK